MRNNVKYICLLFCQMALLLQSCSSSPKPTVEAPAVVIAEVKQEDVPVFIDAIGQSISPVTVEVRPQVSGKLIATYVKQGALVKEGEILYTVDPRPYQAILDEAKAQLQRDLAQLAYAKSTVERYRSIVESDFISQLAFEQYLSSEKAAAAQVEQDKAAIRAAQLNVDFCNIVAPVTGKISYFAVDVGNIVVIDDPKALTSIKPLNPIDVTFSISQQQFEMIRNVQGHLGNWKFTAQLPESDKIIPGTTYFIDNQVNQDTGTILLKGRLANKDLLFWPGEYVKVQVLHQIAEKALVVPPGALLIGNQGPYLYRMNEDFVVEKRDVKVVYRTEEFIALYSPGLKAGDKVVIDGQINISPGIKVAPRQ